MDSDFESVEEKHKQEDTELEREKELQKVMIALQKRFGKNIVLKGLNLKEGEKTIVKEIHEQELLTQKFGRELPIIIPLSTT